MMDNRLPIEELAHFLDERKASSRTNPDLLFPHFLKRLAGRLNRPTDFCRTVPDLLTASIDIELKLDSKKCPRRSSKALSIIIAADKRKLGLIVFELQVLDDVFSIVETPYLKLTDDDFVNLAAANDAAMAIGTHFGVRDQTVGDVLKAIIAVYSVRAALPSSASPALSNLRRQSCKTGDASLQSSNLDMAHNKAVSSKEQAPSKMIEAKTLTPSKSLSSNLIAVSPLTQSVVSTAASSRTHFNQILKPVMEMQSKQESSQPSTASLMKNVVTLIYEGDLVVIEEELLKFVEQKDRKDQSINNGILDALTDMAKLYANANYILMLFDALPMVEAFIDIRVSECYWRLMRALFVALPSFQAASDAFFGLYRKQRNALTPRTNISKKFEDELEVLMKKLRAEGVLEAEWSARQLVNLWLFNIWLNAPLRSKRLVCYCLNSAIVFDMLEELFAPPSPLLAIRVPFRTDRGVSIDKPILLGIMEQQMTPAELNLDLIEMPKWRSDAYARVLLTMCRQRNTDSTAVDASRILYKHAIPLLKVRCYDVALHIICKLVGCPDITLNWDRVETSFNELYQLLAADVPRMDPLTLAALSAMLSYRERSQAVAAVEPQLTPSNATFETSRDDELPCPSLTAAAAADPVKRRRSLQTHA